jgi:hypothetical protein
MSDARTPCDCGDPCSFAGLDGPCWGVVEVVDEWTADDDYGWIHECEAHEGWNDAGPGARAYKVETTPRVTVDGTDAC